MRRIDSDAVSPVVGVMLMLVVVIIIAAVVSAFAGGLSETTEKSPVITIRGTYSQENGMTIEHTGGSTIATQDTNVLVRPSKTFGNAEHMVWTVNKTSITDATGSCGSSLYSPYHCWLLGTGSTGMKSFSGGEMVYIVPPYHTNAFLQPGASNAYKFDRADNLGKTFWLEFVDDAGRVFARNEVTIKP